MSMPPDILISSGNYFNFVEPENSDFTIEDIAQGLSRTCRFGGHTKEFYSVAQHSVLASQIVPNELKLQALLHDAAEAFVGDVPSPLKQLLPDYKAIEKRVEKAVLRRFGIERIDPEVKKADMRMLATEKRDLMPESNLDWVSIKGVIPLNFKVVPLSHDQSYKIFMARFRELS